jgi:hypothetical protein
MNFLTKGKIEILGGEKDMWGVGRESFIGLGGRGLVELTRSPFVFKVDKKKKAFYILISKTPQLFNYLNFFIK